MKLCALVMVKNESHILERCIKSIDKIIDYFIFVDTGSTDNTIEIINKLLETREGELHETTWINFGHNRTEALRFTKNVCDYVVIVDADDIWNVTTKPEITTDCAELRVNTGAEEFDQARFLKSDLDWKYIGIRHAYPDLTNRTTSTIKNMWVKSTQDGASWQDKNKFIKNAIEIELDNPGNDTRKLFYAAYSYHDAGELDRARQLFKQRIKMGGWQEEIWYSQYMVAIIDEEKNKLDRAIMGYLKAINIDNERAEAFTGICRCCRKLKLHGTGYMFGKAAMKMKLPTKLFVKKPLYTTDLYDELSICAYYLEKYPESIALCRKALRDKEISTEKRDRIKSNMKFAEDKNDNRCNDSKKRRTHN